MNLNSEAHAADTITVRVVHQPLDEGLDLSQIAREIARAWLLLLILVCGFGAASYLASFLLPRTYESTSVLIANQSALGNAATTLGSLGSLASLAGLTGGEESALAETVTVLESRSLTSKFILAHQLVQVLFADDWDDQRSEWKDPAEIPSIYDAVRKFENEVRSVDAERLTGIVRLTIRWRSPELAASWANDYVQMFNDEMRERAIAEAQRNFDYLKDQTERVEIAAIREGIYRLMEEQLRNISVAKSRPDFAVRVLEPALPSDADEPDYPVRPLFAAIGVVLGGLVFVLVVLRRVLYRAGR